MAADTTFEIQTRDTRKHGRYRSRWGRLTRGQARMYWAGLNTAYPYNTRVLEHSAHGSRVVARRVGDYGGYLEYGEGF